MVGAMPEIPTLTLHELADGVFVWLQPGGESGANTLRQPGAVTRAASKGTEQAKAEAARSIGWTARAPGSS